MGEYNVAASKHATLVANTVDTVTCTGTCRAIEVINASDFRIFRDRDGVTPTVGGDNTWVIPARGARRFQRRNATDQVVKLISAGAAEYSVTFLP